MEVRGELVWFSILKRIMLRTIVNHKHSSEKEIPHSIYSLFTVTLLRCSSRADPFFMDEDGEDDNQQVKMPEDQSTPIIQGNALLSSLIATSSSRAVTDGKGPSQSGDDKSSETEDPNWEWDGTVDEDAHLD